MQRAREGGRHARVRAHTHTHTHTCARTHTHTVSEFSHRYCHQCPEHKIPRGKSKNQKVELYLCTKYTRPGLPFQFAFGEKNDNPVGFDFCNRSFFGSIFWQMISCCLVVMALLLVKMQRSWNNVFEVCSLCFLLLKETYSVCLMLPVCCCFIFAHNYTDAKC